MSLSAQDKKKIHDKRRAKTRINIGNCFDEWKQIKNDKQLPRDQDVCRFLISTYKQYQELQQVRSTDTTQSTVTADEQPDLTVSSEVDFQSGFACTSTPNIVRKRPSEATSSTIKRKKLLEISGQSESSDSFDGQILDDPTVHTSGLTQPSEESIFTETNIPSMHSNKTTITVSNVEDVNRLSLLLVVEDNLLDLARQASSTCSICKSQQGVQLSRIGTACTIEWICEEGHRNYKWYSQPQLKHGMYAGDLLLSSSIILSGNSYDKIQLMLKYLKLDRGVNHTTFSAVQRELVCPVIENFFEGKLRERVTALGTKEVILCGDGRNDSPGHCAQYCTYTVMEHDSCDILAVVVVDKRETNLKSPNMERLGFKRALDMLLEKGVHVSEVVTDQHPGIIGVMKRDYPDITHSFDIWHVAKNLGKRLTSAATNKNCRDLLPWVSDIVRHFWWVTKECGGSVYIFKEMWRGVLHHVRGKHEWVSCEGTIMTCQHRPDFQEKTDIILKPDAPAFKALQKIILCKRFLNQAKYYVRFRKTGELESFNQLILKYCSKRLSYSFPVYKARNQLAAIDYLCHKDRGLAFNQDNTPRINRQYNKRTNRWTAVQRKEEKSYSYAEELISEVFRQKLDFEGSVTKMKTCLSEGDPRLISPNLAPTAAPSTSEIHESQISRFKKQDLESLSTK